jgi:hypothetical protein
MDLARRRPIELSARRRRKAEPEAAPRVFLRPQVTTLSGQSQCRILAEGYCTGSKRQAGPGGISMTAKRTYCVVSRKHGRAYDVEMTEPGSAPRIVNTFNSEADAWDWLNEQRHVDRFARRMSRNPEGQGGPQ